MSLLSDALEIHFDAMAEAAGEPVTISRGSKSTSVDDAVVGQTRFEEETSDGQIRVLLKSVDWMIRPSDYQFDGVVTEPKRGDTFTRCDGQVFELVPGLDERAWSWADGRQTQYRIHSMRRKAN